MTRKKFQIILVHGIWDNGSYFDHFAKHLSARGHECYMPTLKPSDGRHGLKDLAKKLKAYIDSNLKKDERFVIIGFSMGAMVSRYYLQELKGYKRAKAFFSISGPHNGTITAFFYPGQGTRDMRPFSPFITDLKASQHRLKKVRLYSYWTPFDLLILPAISSIWREARNIIIWALFHGFMIRNRMLIRDISRRIKKL